MHLAKIFNVDGCGVCQWCTGHYRSPHGAWDILDRAFTNHTECVFKNGIGGGTFKLVSGMLCYARDTAKDVKHERKCGEE